MEASESVESQDTVMKSLYEDQQDNNHSTRFNDVHCERMKDYTNIFVCNSAFESKDELISWVHKVGKKNNMVIIIRMSDSGAIGNVKKRPKIIFCCDRGGNYRLVLKSFGQESLSNDQKQSVKNIDKKKRPKATGTKRCGCPFGLRGNNSTGDQWTLQVICGVHNHVSSQSLHGHSYAGRLSKEERAILVDMSTGLMKPKDILTAIKKRDKENVTIMKTIYNARALHRTKAMAGRTQIQCLLTKLREYNYIEHHRSEGDIITDLFWCHPYCLKILRIFPHVLIMDCTYKTNMYCFPLFEIINMISTEKTFNVAFVYMSPPTACNHFIVKSLTSSKALYKVSNRELPSFVSAHS